MITRYTCQGCGLAYVLPGAVEPPRRCPPCERKERGMRWKRRPTYVEMAEALDCHPKTVRARMGRGELRLVETRAGWELQIVDRAPRAKKVAPPPPRPALDEVPDESCTLPPRAAPPTSEELLGREGPYTYVRRGGWVYEVRGRQERRFESAATWPTSTTARRLAQPRRGATFGAGGDLWPIR